MRELFWMAEAKQQADWDQMSTLLATIANLTRSQNQPAVKPADLHPYRKLVRPEYPITVLKKLLDDGS